MTKKRQILAVFVLLVLTVCACKKESVEGKALASITQDRIVAQGGQSYEVTSSDSLQVFYLIRHAEKDSAVKSDPGLSDQGVDRSRTLDTLFRASRLDAIYSTLTTRTIMTVQETAAAKGMTIQPYDPRALDTFATKLMTERIGQRVLIVGHSNTTPQLFRLLSQIDSPVAIGESDYQYFFVVIRDGSTLRDAFYMTYD